jgi:hypothetical protein
MPIFLDEYSQAIQVICDISVIDQNNKINSERFT